MTKINFTKEHFDKLQGLALRMLFSNDAVTTRMGQRLNITDLLHTTTIGTLNETRLSLGKAIEKLENTDEWVADDSTQEKLENLKAKKELVNLVIGYKRFILEREANAREKEILTEKLSELEESKKSPEEKIQEIKDRIKTLESEETL